MHRGRQELAHIAAPMSNVVHSNGGASQQQVKTVKMIEAMLLSPIVKPTAHQPAHDDDRIGSPDRANAGSPLLHGGARPPHHLQHVDPAAAARSSNKALIAAGGRSDAVSPQPRHKGQRLAQQAANTTEAQFVTMVQSSPGPKLTPRSKTPSPHRKTERHVADYVERMRFHCNGCVVKKIGGGFSVVGISDGHGNCVECHRPIDYDCETKENLNLARLEVPEANPLECADVSRSEGSSPSVFSAGHGLISPPTENRSRKG